MCLVRRSAYKKRNPDELSIEECVEILKTSDGKGTKFKMAALARLLRLASVDEKLIQLLIET